MNNNYQLPLNNSDIKYFNSKEEMIQDITKLEIDRDNISSETRTHTQSSPSTDQLMDENEYYEEKLITRKREKTIADDAIAQIIAEEKNDHTNYKPRSRIGYIKEGYMNLEGINPIDRYNFVISRYNEEFNQIDNITLHTIPIHKLFRSLYDLYIWQTRMILSVFLIITYYFHLIKYSIRRMKETEIPEDPTINLLLYKKYLLNEDDDYFPKKTSLPRSILLVILGIIFLAASIYIIALFYFIMLIPNIFFTFYIMFSYFIHRRNIKLVNNIFPSMILEKSLDKKGQLNDYIYVEPNSVHLYSGCSFYEQLKVLYDKKDGNQTQTFMLYGELFANEYNVIKSSLYKQLLGACGMLVIGIVLYTY